MTIQTAPQTTPQAADEQSSGVSLFQIKSLFTGEILFELKTKSLKLCVETAVKAQVNLSWADLVGSNLAGADLSGANLSKANLSGANLSGANLSKANLSKADLAGSNLAGVDLSESDLSGVDLSGVDLSGANLLYKDQKIKIKKTPICISNLYFKIVIFDKHIKIGCQLHPIADWFNFDDETISKMDTKALSLWTQNKSWLKSLCDANGRS